MKKLVILFVALISAGFLMTSCSDDDESASIEGKWEFYQAGAVVNGQEVLEPWDHTEGCDKDFIELLSGGTYRDVLHSNFGEGCEEESTSGTWSKNGNSLTITSDGETMTITILTLNDSTLKLSIAEDFEGVPTTVIVVFKRP